MGRLLATHKESVMDLTWYLKKAVKYDHTKKVEKQASETSLRGILGYTEDQEVSRDLNIDSYSFNFDAVAGLTLKDCVVKLISVYDKMWLQQQDSRYHG